jgi:hypothetical protein
MKGYTEKAQNIMKREKKGEINKKLTQLKYDLINVYCMDMIKDFNLFSLRVVLFLLYFVKSYFVIKQYTRILQSFLDELRYSPSLLAFKISSFDPDSLLSKASSFFFFFFFFCSFYDKLKIEIHVPKDQKKGFKGLLFISSILLNL